MALDAGWSTVMNVPLPITCSGATRSASSLPGVALVGAVWPARAVDDPGLSDEIVKSTARALHGYVESAETV